MGCDMVVALGSATVNGQTLFGQNLHRPPDECQVLRRVQGRPYALGEMIRTTNWEIPQARQTYTVLGSQPSNCWGFSNGVNEHHLALGCAGWRSKLERQPGGLLGTDLVRLTLERCRTARQGLDFLTDLVCRHGQGQPLANPGDGTDNLFLIADGREAFVLEAAGQYWAALECRALRAVCDVSIVRQDWDSLSHGLAELAIKQGWWPDDGSKLDFAKSLRATPGVDPGAMKRWGRATWLLEQQNGHIDADFVRGLLSDHFEGTGSEVDPLGTPNPHVVPLCRHQSGSPGLTTSVSFVSQLGADPTMLPLAWCAFGPPCCSLFFPVFLEGELPEPYFQGTGQTNLGGVWWRTQELLSAIGSSPQHGAKLREDLSQVQERFDQEAEDFLEEATTLIQRGDREKVRRLASLLMENHLEQFERLVQGITPIGSKQPMSLGLAHAVEWGF